MSSAKINTIEQQVLEKVAGLCDFPEGAYNIRVNGKSISHQSSANIDVELVDGGLIINVKPGTKQESVHIPVIISKTGVKETVRNTFNIGEGADVVIIAGCGIFNCGVSDSEHNGIHVLNVAKNAKVKYIEKHYGSGNGRGARTLNPTTEVHMESDSVVEMELEQIKGVDSTVRKTVSSVGDDAKLVIREKLMTHGRQTADSVIVTTLNGKDSSADIVSRAVAQDQSVQKFHSRIDGKNKCHGHSECDAIIMDKAKVLAEPALNAESQDAELIHEAAIGKIAGEQITKLLTFGLTQAEAESLIINGFLK